MQCHRSSFRQNFALWISAFVLLLLLIFQLPAFAESQNNKLQKNTTFEEVFNNALAAENDTETWRLLEPHLPQNVGDKYYGESRYLLALRSESLPPSLKARSNEYAFQAMDSGIANASLRVDAQSLLSLVSSADRIVAGTKFFHSLVKISQTGSPFVPLQMTLVQNARMSREGYKGIDYFSSTYAGDALYAGSSIANRFVLLDPETPSESKQRACARLANERLFDSITFCRKLPVLRSPTPTYEEVRRYSVRAQSLWANRLESVVTVLCPAGTGDVELQLQCNDILSTAAAICLLYNETTPFQSDARRNVCNLNDLQFIRRDILDVAIE